MKRILFVVILVLTNLPTYANNIITSIDGIESAWAETYYDHTQVNTSKTYQQLLQQAESLSTQFPNRAEPVLWQAILIATDADQQPPLKALAQINQAHDLLLKAIDIDPNGVAGSAQATLGTLYYMAPAWPIAFGDSDKAEQFFLAALKINPNNIEANYYYGDFLHHQNKISQAEFYFKKAITIPPRKNQMLADKSLQQQATTALHRISQGTSTPSKRLLLSRFNSTQSP